MAELSRRPEARNEVVPVRRVWDHQFSREFERAAESLAAHRELALSLTREAPEEHELLTGEHVRDVHRVDLADVDGAAPQLEIGQNRMLDLRGEQRQRPLDVLAGQHIVRIAPARLTEAIQKLGVYVVADAEREYTRTPRLGLGDARESIRRFLTDRRKTVREEEHDRKAVPRALQAERFLQGGFDVRPAIGYQAVDPCVRLFQGAPARRNPFPTVHAHGTRKRHEPKTIFRR